LGKGRGVRVESQNRFRRGSGPPRSIGFIGTTEVMPCYKVVEDWLYSEYFRSPKSPTKIVSLIVSLIVRLKPYARSRKAREGLFISLWGRN